MRLSYPELIGDGFLRQTGLVPRQAQPGAKFPQDLIVSGIIIGWWKGPGQWKARMPR